MASSPDLRKPLALLEQVMKFALEPRSKRFRKVPAESRQQAQILHSPVLQPPMSKVAEVVHPYRPFES